MNSSELDPDEVQEKTYINDIRENFRCITFSNYKLTQVKSQLLESMFKEKIEQACYWTAELICSGHFLDLWETILLFYGKHVHNGNPKMAVYLDKRYTVFKNIVEQSIFTHILQLRNNEKIRELFAEIITVLCVSPKKRCSEHIKLDRTEEFNILQLPEKLKATSIEYAPFFREKDPKELFIAINEFSYNISKDSKNSVLSCYWCEWILEFDAICRTKKTPCYCDERTEFKDFVEPKYWNDVVWLIWDALLYYCQLEHSPFIQSTMRSLMNLFCIKYTSSTSKKRRHLIYSAIELLTENINTNIELVASEKKEIIKRVVKNIHHTIYSEIKKNEEMGDSDDELFQYKQCKKNNIEKSLKKMELVDKFSFVHNGNDDDNGNNDNDDDI